MLLSSPPNDKGPQNYRYTTLYLLLMKHTTIGKPTTYLGLSKKLRTSFTSARKNGRTRMRKCRFQTLEKQQRQYHGKHWKLYLSCTSPSTVQEKDGTYRNVVDWYTFANTIINEYEEKCAAATAATDAVLAVGASPGPALRNEWEDWYFAYVILEALHIDSYDEDEYCEWHHMNALCMYGANEDWNQWVRLPYILHIQVHQAYVHFFPKSTKLIFALHKTAFGRSFGHIDVMNLTEDNLLELNELRKEAIAMTSERMKGNQIALKPHDETKQKRRDISNRCTLRRRLIANCEEVTDNVKKQKGDYVPIVYSGDPRVDKRLESVKLNNIRKKLNKARDKENQLCGRYKREDLDHFEKLQGEKARHYIYW